jgi:hypothetical protein
MTTAGPFDHCRLLILRAAAGDLTDLTEFPSQRRWRGSAVVNTRIGRLRAWICQLAIMLRHEYPQRRGKRNILAFMLVDDAEQSAQRRPARISNLTQILPELRLKR